MPQKGQEEALQWLTEGKYLAISEDSMETTVMTTEQSGNCLGQKWPDKKTVPETVFLSGHFVLSFRYNSINSLRHTKNTSTVTTEINKSWLRHMAPHISVTGVYTTRM